MKKVFKISFYFLLVVFGIYIINGIFQMIYLSGKGFNNVSSFNSIEKNIYFDNGDTFNLVSKQKIDSLLFYQYELNEMFVLKISIKNTPTYDLNQSIVLAPSFKLNNLIDNKSYIHSSKGHFEFSYNLEIQEIENFVVYISKKEDFLLGEKGSNYFDIKLKSKNLIFWDDINSLPICEFKLKSEFSEVLFVQETSSWSIFIASYINDEELHLKNIKTLNLKK